MEIKFSKELQEVIEKEKFEDVKKSLGSTVSKVCGWNGVNILDVLQIALEDSNFHTLNKEITKMTNAKKALRRSDIRKFLYSKNAFAKADISVLV